jgi:hypothetical protein
VNAKPLIQAGIAFIFLDRRLRLSRGDTSDQTAQIWPVQAGVAAMASCSFVADGGLVLARGVGWLPCPNLPRLQKLNPTQCDAGGEARHGNDRYYSCQARRFVHRRGMAADQNANMAMAAGKLPQATAR